jgi:hypothetical protein
VLTAAACDSSCRYDNDQLKAMRQDLTVQRLHVPLTCEVYECHARLALKAGDWGEFNQCQTVLSDLYKEGLPGCTTEFLAYRVRALHRPLQHTNRSTQFDLMAQ